MVNLPDTLMSHWQKLCQHEVGDTYLKNRQFLPCLFDLVSLLHLKQYQGKMSIANSNKSVIITVKGKNRHNSIRSKNAVRFFCCTSHFLLQVNLNCLHSNIVDKHLLNSSRFQSRRWYVAEFSKSSHINTTALRPVQDWISFLRYLLICLVPV